MLKLKFIKCVKVKTKIIFATFFAILIFYSLSFSDVKDCSGVVNYGTVTSATSNSTVTSVRSLPNNTYFMMDNILYMKRYVNSTVMLSDRPHYPGAYVIVYDSEILFYNCNTSANPVQCSSFFTVSVSKSDTCAPTCSDGIKNQGETGIDCGGPCAACIDVPQSNYPADCKLNINIK